MPYINQDLRPELDYSYQPRNAGELNYVITRVIQSYLAENKTNYATYNTAIGALECAKLELYRRLISPYEDVKIKENGDVYP